MEFEVGLWSRGSGGGRGLFISPSFLSFSLAEKKSVVGFMLLRDGGRDHHTCKVPCGVHFHGAWLGLTWLGFAFCLGLGLGLELEL